MFLLSVCAYFDFEYNTIWFLVFKFHVVNKQVYMFVC